MSVSRRLHGHTIFEIAIEYLRGNEKGARNRFCLFILGPRQIF